MVTNRVKDRVRVSIRISVRVSLAFSITTASSSSETGCWRRALEMAAVENGGPPGIIVEKLG